MWCCCKWHHWSWDINKIIYRSRIWNTQTTSTTDTTGWSTTEPRGERSMMPYYYFFFSPWSLIYISGSLFRQVPQVIMIGAQSPWLSASTGPLRSVFVKWEVAPCKGIRIPESVKFLLVKSRIRKNFPCGIRNPGLWNLEYSSRNPGSY